VLLVFKYNKLPNKKNLADLMGDGDMHKVMALAYFCAHFTSVIGFLVLCPSDATNSSYTSNQVLPS
jgi:hypothetical protein